MTKRLQKTEKTVPLSNGHGALTYLYYKHEEFAFPTALSIPGSQNSFEYHKISRTRHCLFAFSCLKTVEIAAHAPCPKPPNPVL